MPISNGNFTSMSVTEMTRRELTAALAAPLLAAAAGASRVIDVAVHFYDTNRAQGVPWPRATEPVLYKPSLPARYLEAIKPNRVDGVVAIEASPWLEDNLWLLTLGENHPLIRAVVGNIPPGHPDFRAALDRFAKHPLFRGIRIGGGALDAIFADNKRMSDLAFLSEKGLSLDVLVSAAVDYGRVARLATQFPALRIIVGHLPLDDAAGLRQLADHPSVFAKASGVVRRVNGNVPTDAAFYKRQLDEVWSVFGADRLLFASNWPTCDLIAPYPVVYQVIADYMAGKPSAQLESFFSLNAQRVYRLTA